MSLHRREESLIEDTDRARAWKMEIADSRPKAVLSLCTSQRTTTLQRDGENGQTVSLLAHSQLHETKNNKYSSTDLTRAVSEISGTKSVNAR